jgi:hypothetical protein
MWNVYSASQQFVIALSIIISTQFIGISAACIEVKVPDTITVVCYGKEAEYHPKLHQ